MQMQLKRCKVSTVEFHCFTVSVHSCDNYRHISTLLHVTIPIYSAGNYATANAPFLISPLQGFVELGFHVKYAEGCRIAEPIDSASVAAAVRVAKDADTVIVVVGLDESQEGEGHDRTSLLLPPNQVALIEAVAAASTDPIVVLLMSGSALDVSRVVGNHKVGAIMWVGYPGQAGGAAIAEAVMGVTPVSGRLPMTWYMYLKT